MRLSLIQLELLQDVPWQIYLSLKNRPEIKCRSYPKIKDLFQRVITLNAKASQREAR